MNNNLKPVETLKPFTRFLCTIGELPTSYLVSMTYEEQLIWFCNYLEKTVIPTINNNAEAVKEVQDLFVELKNYVDNYFNNLDVQEEINNKLDDMVEQGTLQEIISDYLNSKALFCFDNVNGMKTATNFIDGSYAKTLGYYDVNDGGGATYKIRTITNDDVVDEMTIIALDDETLIAELIEDEVNVLNVLQCGAYRDGITDNSVIFNKVIDYANAHSKNIFIPNGEYVVNDDLHDINSPISIYGNISGAGAFEKRTTIIDTRTSNNYLLTFTRNNLTGGIIQYITFKNMSNLYINKCILLENDQCYQGFISNCNFYQYGIALNLINTHGINIDKSSFIKCGSGTANSTDYAIKIYACVDCSLSNLMIDHSRFQLYIENQAYVSVVNCHFEMSTVNVVQGKAPIYCETGLYGQAMFSNCTMTGLPYKYWMNTLNITAAQVPFMFYGTYANLDNCILSCGSGSGEYTTQPYTKQCKFADMYYGTISNCKIKSPSYMVNSFTLHQSKMINSHIQCDLEVTDYESITKNSRIVYNDTNLSKENYLQFIVPTTDPQTYPTIYPVLYYYYSDMTQIESNKHEILYTPIIKYDNLQDYNTFKIQAKNVLSGNYKLKIYSTAQVSLIYEGYFRINGKNVVLSNTIYKNFGGGYGAKIYTDDNSNDIYIQVEMLTYHSNQLMIVLEGLEGNQDVICYYVPSMTTAYSSSHVLDLTA